MSGLCGWYAPGPVAIALERMAAPIGRFERTPLRSATHAGGAVALSGSIDCTSLLEEDGLIVALWGSPGQHARTLAQRWRSHGAWAAAALSGQFAFAILDAQRGEALIAVDRFATRPLFFQQCGDSLVFASSQDALLRHPLAGRVPSAEALYQYLVLGAMPGSAWDGQHQLGPGECVHLRGGELVRHTWWRMRFNEQANDGAAGMQGAVQMAVAQARGHQQPGVMLSGGVASAALAAQLQGQREPGAAPLSTFSVAYANGPDEGGLHPARHAAGVLGTHHYHQVVRPADLADAIPKLATLCDRPCGDSSAVAYYHCAMLARAQGTLRLLCGTGLAELFGAGPLAARHARMARYDALPATLRQLVIEPLRARFSGMDQASRDLPARVVHASVFGAGAAPPLAAAFLEQVDTAAPLALLRQWWWSAQCHSGANRAIALDLRAGLPARLAASQAGACLAGVDVAYPYLDDGVADCAAHADPRRKHGGRHAHHARILRALVPGPLARRRHAHGLPFTTWLQSEPDLRALTFDSLADLRRRDIVAPSLIDALLATPMAAPGPGFGALVWQLMMLEQWFVHRAPHRMLGGAVPAASAPALVLDEDVPAPPVAPCHADDPHPVRVTE